MPLTPEQVAELKEQLRQQVQDLPDDQKSAALEQIDSMSDEAIETMLQQQQAQSQQQPIFRSIVSGEIPSKIIDQNKQVIAVLDIKPISPGHTVIIPKKEAKNTNEVPPQAFSMAKKISRKIINKLKAQGTEIQTQFSFGEVIVNVIPVYDKPVNINSPREEAKEEDLENLHKTLRVVKKPKVIRQRKPRKSNVIKLKRRIP